MQLRNKALAGVAVMIALAGCASQEKKTTKTVSENDAALQQQKAQLAYQQQMAYQANLANAQGGGCKKDQAAGKAAAPEITPAPSCNCSCTPEGSKSSVDTGKVKASATTHKKSTQAETLVD